MKQKSPRIVVWTCNTPGIARLVAREKLPVEFLELGGRAHGWLHSPRSQRRLLRGES